MISNESEPFLRRRANSVTRAEEIKTNEDKKRKSQPDRPYVIWNNIIYSSGL